MGFAIDQSRRCEFQNGVRGRDWFLQPDGAYLRPDVLVVGLGPAGARAAATAAAAGHRVLAVEKRSAVGSPVQCAEFVSAVLSLEAVRWDEVSCQPIARMLTIVEGEAPSASVDLRGRMISRLRFDRALARDAVAHGARCATATAINRVLADGRVLLSNGLEIRPRILVGADGPRSRVGAAIARKNTAFVATRQMTVPIAHAHDATDIYLRAGYRGGYAWLFPKGDLANLGVGVDYAFRNRLKALLDGLHADLAGTMCLSRGNGTALTGGLIPVGGRLRAAGRLRDVPVLLAGDAAGLTNPVTGSGIEAAVRSGELAGAACADWLAGRAGACDDYEDELAALYDAGFARALRRRRDILDHYARGKPDTAALKRAWISSPDYWSNTAQ